MVFDAYFKTCYCFFVWFGLKAFHLCFRPDLDAAGRGISIEEAGRKFDFLLFFAFLLVGLVLAPLWPIFPLLPETWTPFDLFS